MSDENKNAIEPLTDGATTKDIKARIDEAESLLEASETLLKTGILTQQDVDQIREVKAIAERLLKIAKQNKV